MATSIYGPRSASADGKYTYNKYPKRYFASVYFHPMRPIERPEQMTMLREQLDAVRQTGSGRFAWLLGPRRLGKSWLVDRFARESDCPYVFFQSPRRAKATALDMFRSELSQSSLPAAPDAAGVTFSDWRVALRMAARDATTEHPSIIVIDELPYLVEQDPGFAADLQAAWDRDLQTAPVLLIAIGSERRMMQELVSYPAPLHGRPTIEIQVPPFTPAQMATLLGIDDPAAALDAYMVVGGYPALAQAWSPGVPALDFIRDSLRNPSSALVTTAIRILDAEFPSGEAARDVLEAVGASTATFTTVLQTSGRTRRTVEESLKDLVNGRCVVTKEEPLCRNPPGRRTRYMVNDPYLRFWLRFIHPKLGQIDRGRGDDVAAYISNNWATFSGRSVEPLVRDALALLLARDGTFRGALRGSRVVGSWWLSAKDGEEASSKRDAEVDIVLAESERPASVPAIGSIKWRARKRFERRDVAALERARELVPGASGAQLIAVSRSGMAKDAKVDIAFGPEEIFDAWS